MPGNTNIKGTCHPYQKLGRWCSPLLVLPRERPSVACAHPKQGSIVGRIVYTSSHLTAFDRSHPTIRLYLCPQAVSLLVDLAEELCLGAAHAGDIIPDLLDSAFGVLGQPPPTSAAGASSAGVPSPPSAGGTRREMAVFRRLPHPNLATEAGLRSAFGGREALARLLSPPPPAS